MRNVKNKDLTPIPSGLTLCPFKESAGPNQIKIRRRKMLTVNGVYDKGKIELIKEVPIKGKRRVVVTFLDEPLVETDLGLEIDPIRVLKGCATGLNLTEKLLESRKEDLNLEESKWGR